MSLKTLNLDTLGDLDRGAAGIAINHAIKQAIDDTVDRGREDGKPRTVTINLELTSNPRGDQFGATVKVGWKGPQLQTSITHADIKYTSVGGERKNHLVFQAESNRPDQPAMFNPEEEGASS